MNDDPDSRLSWSIFLLVGVVVGIPIAFALALLHFLPMRTMFATALAIAVFCGLILNRMRPRDADAAGRWQAFYDWLRRQLPPPD